MDNSEPDQGNATSLSEAPDEREQRRVAAAKRASAEAEARREEAQKSAQPTPKEIDGRGGLDPVRYDDWEIKGLTSDF
jgi:hypothetical protein